MPMYFGVTRNAQGLESAKVTVSLCWWEFLFGVEVPDRAIFIHIGPIRIVIDRQCTH